jgi:hypothetical protein
MKIGKTYSDAGTGAIEDGLIVEGKVGIGKNIPESKLDVSANTGIAIRGLISDSTTHDKYGVVCSAEGNWGKKYGLSASARGQLGSSYGVYASATGSIFWTPESIGVDAVASGSGSVYGVRAIANSLAGGSASYVRYGVYASSTGVSYATYYGVYGLANGPSSTPNYGVYGSGATYDFYAGGSGVNYGPFTGSHEVKIAPGIKIEKGMIVSVTSETQIRNDSKGEVNLSSTLSTIRLSDKENDSGVFGVFIEEVNLPNGHWYKGKKGERFGVVNALGEGRVWITDINGEIKTGDYITTSLIPGYGQKQDDDVVHNYTLGKAIERVSWDKVDDFVEYNGKEYKRYLIAVVYTSG